MKILGVKIDNLSLKQVLRKIEDFLKCGQQRYIVTPNPEFLVRAQKDREFRRILNRADISVPDGVGLVLAAKFLGQPLKQRIVGVDLMEKICQRAVQKKWTVFLLGGKEETAKKTAENLREKYSGLEIQEIREVRGRFLNFEGCPGDILFVALGAPKQEKWIVENLKKMPSVKLAMGVGGAFDFLSGRVQRAPVFLRKIGLEWLWRLICQPWRIERISKAVFVFPWLVIRDYFRKRGQP